MSRASRVPYHQNVYDLIQIDPGESPVATLMIAEHEAKHGPLPASMREWYLVPNVVSLRRLYSARGIGWNARTDDPPRDLPSVLDQFAQVDSDDPPWPYVCVIDGHQQERRYLVEIDGSDDPPVYDDYGSEDPGDWECVWDTFSDFLMFCFAEYRPFTKYAPPEQTADEWGPKPYSNGLWIRSPDEPLQPPVIDFLIDHFGEPERTPRPGDVTTHTFRLLDGIIRVTADDPALTGGLSAWWVHADTPERLAEFARLLRPWGTLRDTLRADTDPARDVLKRVLNEPEA